MAWFIWFLVGAAIADDASRVYRSARLLGRGDTGIADVEEEDAIHYNPASLATGEGIYKRTIFASPQFEASSAVRDVYQNLVVEEKDQTDTLRQMVGKGQSLGVSNLSALVLRRAALGFTSSNRLSLLVHKDKDENALESVDVRVASNQIGSFSLADQFYDGSLMVGGTYKYISRVAGRVKANLIDAVNIQDLQDDDLIGRGTGQGGDIGLRLRVFENDRAKQIIGLQVTDVGDTQITPLEDSGPMDPIKQSVNLGWMLEVNTGLSFMKMLVDYYDIMNAYHDSVLWKIHAGAEINVLSMVGVTGGVYRGYPSFGFYVDFYLMRLDVGVYTEELGETLGSYPDQRVFARLTVGI
jgi:hypothetical protein